MANKTKRTACGRAIQHFFQTTTLHGFKYLCSKYYADRVGWLICCCASACCAGVLCAVLWARFLEVPALLTLHDFRGQQNAVEIPLVAICPPAETVADLFHEKLIINASVTNRLKTILKYVLRRKVTSMEQLIILEDILIGNNLTLPQALMRVMPPCSKIVKNCRLQSSMVPCRNLFNRELTEWGLCCILRPEKLKISKTTIFHVEQKRNLDIAVQCSDQQSLDGCDFYTKYNGEDWIEPISLATSYNYLAQITFTSVVDSDPEKLVDRTCSNANGFSRSRCLLECQERLCGCSDPLKEKKNERNVPAPCFMTQLNCLRDFDFEDLNCNCLPSCKKVSTFLSLESSPMNALEYSFDKIYADINPNTTTVLHISVGISGSRSFLVNPTDTWITLLSSLGGVFNMFLGVGLFSALEVLFLIFFRLPIALRKSNEMESPSTVTN